jgi:hypothetical protein
MGFGYSCRLAGAPVAEWTLSWRWFSPFKHLVMLLSPIVCFAILVLWYYMFLSSDDVPWQVVAFSLLYVGAGISIGYIAVAGLLNSTTLAIKDGVLTVRHGPLPWRGNHTLPTEELRQLFCQQHISSYRGGGGTPISYEVHAQLDGREVKLVRGLEESRQALYIEQLVEGTLGIEDVPVPGELWMG